MTEEKYKNIAPFKRWSKYTEEEKNILPKLPEHLIKGERTPWMWMGDRWEYIMGD